jgi:hypothetical protein
MPKQNSKSQQQTIAHIYRTLALIAAVLLLVVGSLALWANKFTTNMVTSELSAQKIYFPEKGSPGLDPETYPDLQQYAGQLVDSPEKARAYANGFIGRHLENIADGRVYSEVSSDAQKNPTDQKLQQQRQALFMGETLRGILLGTGYAFGVVGKIAGIAAAVSYLGSVALFGSAVYFHRKARS